MKKESLRQDRRSKICTPRAPDEANIVTCVCEHTGGGDDHTEPVGDDGVGAGVVQRLVSLHTPSNGVGEAVTEVHPSVTKSDPGKGRGQMHF